MKMKEKLIMLIMMIMNEKLKMLIMMILKEKLIMKIRTIMIKIMILTRIMKILMTTVEPLKVTTTLK